MSEAGEILKNAATSAIAAQPGVCTSFGLAIAGRLHLGDGIEAGRGLLEIRRVAAHRAAHDKVLARVGVDHELLRLRAAHGARIGLDGDELEAAASEYCSIGSVVQIEALIETASSMSKEYASFMMNWRTRSRPDLGRGSSRNLV